MALERSQEVPDPVNWGDPEEVDRLRWLCSQESPEGLSALARHVLGYDFFDTERGTKGKYRASRFKEGGRVWHTCGVVNYGPHREMAKALTSRQDVFLLCSRRSMKTTLVVTRIVQLIALNRDIRILCQMETGKLAEATVTLVGEHLKLNDKLIRLFGEFYEKGKLWAKNAIVVAGRTKPLRDPTLSAHGGETRAQGNRYDVFVVDDPIGHQAARSPDLVAKANQTFDATLPQGDEGSFILGAMTPYTTNDLSQRALKDSDMGIKVIRFDCGMIAKKNEANQVVLEGSLRFPNHSKESLIKIAKRNIEEFNLNFGLVIGTDANAVFTRADFPVEPYDDRFRIMNCYVMTDTAVSDHNRACMSALALVAIDSNDVAYILDANVGFWSPQLFLENFLEMFQSWAPRVRIVGVVMELNAANRVYRTMIEGEMGRRNLSARWILTPRNARMDKGTRIKSLLPRVHSRRLRFVDSIRQHYRGSGGDAKTMFSPHGVQVDGKHLPGGEIVEQIINWRDTDYYDGICDFPDALGDLDLQKATGERYLQPSQKSMVWDDPDDWLAQRRNRTGPKTLSDAVAMRQGGLRDDSNDNSPAWARYI